jgi:hypothetical protein
MRSSIQQTLLLSLNTVLRPIVKLILRAGLGYSEFAAIAKTVFVQIATEEYGLRGRPTNMSRVSAMTGISRKEVSRVRNEGPFTRWTPAALATIPANEVLHYWHHDADFCLSPGRPRPLPFEGAKSFSTLVARYAGDIPPGAMRTALREAGALEETHDVLSPRERFFFSGQFDEDFIRGIVFSLSNLANTIVHNALLRQNADKKLTVKELFFERSAWTDHIGPERTADFRDWISIEARRFIESADQKL